MKLPKKKAVKYLPAHRNAKNFAASFASPFTDALKNQGTRTLNVSDLLNSRKWRNVTEGDNFRSESSFQWHSRQINLAFNYRINQNKAAAKNKTEDGG